MKEILHLIERSRKPVLVLIAGASCSGKTSLAFELKKKIHRQGWRVSILSLDEFFKDIDDPGLPRNEFDQKLFDVVNSYHYLEFLRILHALVSGIDARTPCYDIVKAKRAPDKIRLIKANPVIIAEGLFVISLADDCWNNMVKIYVDTGIDTCLKRRLERDTVRFGVSKEQVEREWEQKVLPNYERFVLPQRSQADIVIKIP
ncbi:MAG: adenylyl-sulfate kinase [bacterium]|nr:adenylyl-sulfate kinase [bacterium]